MSQVKEVVLKSATVLEADVVVAGIGNVIALETVLKQDLNNPVNNPEGLLFRGISQFLFFCFCLTKLSALSGSCVSVCASQFSLGGLFDYLHSNLSTDPYFLAEKKQCCRIFLQFGGKNQKVLPGCSCQKKKRRKAPGVLFPKICHPEFIREKYISQIQSEKLKIAGQEYSGESKP